MFDLVHEVNRVLHLVINDPTSINRARYSLVIRSTILLRFPSTMQLCYRNLECLDTWLRAHAAVVAMGHDLFDLHVPDLDDVAQALDILADVNA